MLEASAITHEFSRVEIPIDRSSLYTAFRHVNGTFDTINNERLRCLVADYIRGHKNLHLDVLQSGTSCKSVKEYCNKIEKNNLPGGKLEIRALIMLAHRFIRVVSIKKTDEGSVSVDISSYYEDTETFKDCVYILHDEEKEHYDPLYVINKQDPNDKMTIFKHEDPMIAILLDKFIQEKCKGNNVEQSDCPNSPHATERSTETSLINETGDIFHKIKPMASISLPPKRKLPGYENLMSKPTNVIDTNCVSEKPAKLAKLDNHKSTSFNKTNTQPETVEEHLQVGIVDLVEMKFEADPMGTFRGRTRGDFIRKKPLAGEDEPILTGSPRYITDGNTRQYLNLLIPNTYLSADHIHYCLEICVVTRNINGYTYIHPYFKFLRDRTDAKFETVNPLYKFIDRVRDLTSTVDKLFQQLQLKLVLVMHVIPELMQAEQPLKIFPTSTNNHNQPPITAIYDTLGKFKDAYHLHDLRFAITLCKVNQDNKICHRYDDKTYFSSVLTKEKKAKV